VSGDGDHGYAAGEQATCEAVAPVGVCVGDQDDVLASRRVWSLRLEGIDVVHAVSQRVVVRPRGVAAVILISDRAPCVDALWKDLTGSAAAAKLKRNNASATMLFPFE
jgi:hypothetical protein